MKHTTFNKGGWKISVPADRAPNQSKNLMHGNNTIIGDVPATLTLAHGRGRYHGATCGACLGFPCDKTPRAEQDYCAYYPSRFRFTGEGKGK